MAGGVVLPDVMAAVLTLLRADPDVAALCHQNLPSGAAPRIAVSFPETPDPNRQWEMPDFAVLARRAGGPPADLEIGEHAARIEIITYGPGTTISIRRRTADQLWRTVHPVLCPPVGKPANFRLANTEVFMIYPESEPIPSMEPGTDWARVVTSYLLYYASARISA